MKTILIIPLLFMAQPEHHSLPRRSLSPEVAFVQQACADALNAFRPEPCPCDSTGRREYVRAPRRSRDVATNRMVLDFFAKYNSLEILCGCEHDILRPPVIHFTPPRRATDTAEAYNWQYLYDHLGTLNRVCECPDVVLPADSVEQVFYVMDVFDSSQIGDIEQWDKNAGTFTGLILNTSATTDLRALCLDAKKRLLYFTKRVTTTTTFFSVSVDGTGETSEIDITNGQGAPANWSRHDDARQLAFVMKPSMIVQVDTLGGSGAMLQTKIGKDSNGKGFDTGMDFDTVNQLVYYGYDNATPPDALGVEIRAVAYGASTSVADATVALNSDFTTGGVTNDSEIHGLAYHTGSGLLYCVNEAGELFSVNTSTAATTLLVENTEWDFYADMATRPRGLVYDAALDVLWMAATRSSTNNYIMKIPIGNPTANTAAFEVVNASGKTLEGFDIGDLVTPST